MPNLDVCNAEERSKVLRAEHASLDRAVVSYIHDSTGDLANSHIAACRLACVRATPLVNVPQHLERRGCSLSQLMPERGVSSSSPIPFSRDPAHLLPRVPR